MIWLFMLALKIMFVMCVLLPIWGWAINSDRDDNSIMAKIGKVIVTLIFLFAGCGVLATSC